MAESKRAFEIFEQERRSSLAPGEREPDYEEEWDDFTLSERKPYFERAEATGAVAAGVARSVTEGAKPRPSSRPPKRPAPEPVTTGCGGGVGVSVKSPTMGNKASTKRPKTAFELWKREQPDRGDGGDEEETPDVGALSDRRLGEVC